MDKAIEISYKLHIWPQILIKYWIPRRFLYSSKTPEIVFTYMYLTIEMSICNCLSHFKRIHCTRKDYHWKKMVGLQYIFICKAKLCSFGHFLKTGFCTYRWNQNSITNNTVRLLKVKYIPCYAVKKLQNNACVFQMVGIVIKKYPLYRLWILTTFPIYPAFAILCTKCNLSFFNILNYLNIWLSNRTNSSSCDYSF